jgi:hypothetical protein
VRTYEESIRTGLHVADPLLAFREAIERARRLDPVSASIGWDRVWFLYLAGDSERALAAFDRESQNSQPVYLYGALIEQGRGNTRARVRSAPRQQEFLSLGR